jgi:ABC-2 type transport system ATP-binding protein
MELNIVQIKKSYNKKVVVDIPELQINRNEIVGLIGNNGAGKTTFLKLIIDLIKADTGYILSRGKYINKSSDWKQYTSAYLDDGFLIDFLTPEEYFNFIANSYHIESRYYDEVLNSFMPFMNNEILNQKKYIREYSSGNRQKIGIIGAFISKPDILILDEPFNFLDPTSQNELQQYIKEYAKENQATIIISSHNIDCILKIATRLILMENGTFIKDTKDIDNVSLAGIIEKRVRHF